MSHASRLVMLVQCGLVCLLLASSDPVLPPADSAASEPTDTGTVLLAAGDIAACDLPGAAMTAELIDGLPGPVLALGDQAYEDGSARDFAECYDPVWGHFKARTWPVPGNHEYHTRDATAYFAYFGVAAGEPGQGWYSFDFAGWHVIALNSNCEAAGCEAGSAQETWLRADLAAHPVQCTLAFWHHPLFGSGPNGGTVETRPFWRALYEAGADVVLNAHNHLYERFAPQDPAGNPDPTAGLREFTVGTGGGSLHPEVKHPANREVINTGTWGVLKLQLQDNGYAWQFVPTAGSTFTDSGQGTCH
jgi:acid phosphatase type 7